MTVDEAGRLLAFQEIDARIDLLESLYEAQESEVRDLNKHAATTGVAAAFSVGQ